MDVEIKHINNTFNYGSMMMAITLIDKLNKEFKDVNIYIDTLKEIEKENLSRLKDETGIKNIYSYEEKIIRNRIARYIDKSKKLIFKKKKDVQIVIGGDDISEYYGLDNLNNLLESIKHETKFNHIFLVGQTIGPFTENREITVINKLKNTKIYTRDDKCLKYLKKLKFNNVSGGRDLAFLELPMQNNAKNILKKYGLERDEYFTIVMSGLAKSYTDNLDAYITEQINIIKSLLKKEKLKHKKIVLLPHVLLPVNVDDRLIIRKVMKRLDTESKAKIIAIDDEMLASEAREILGNGIFTITGRMHAAVSTFYMRKPAISLSYSVKYAGVIGDGLDMNELVIESANNKLWEYNQISSLVSKKVDYILENYEMIIKKIDKKVSETSKITEKQLNDLVNNIKLKKGV